MAEAGCMRDVAVQNLEINGHTTTTGNLVVNGSLFNSLFGKKEYVFRMTANAGTDAAADSIQQIATGFVAGQHVIQTLILITTPSDGAIGALAFEIGTNANTVRDAVGGTAITNAASVANPANAAVTAYGTSPADNSAQFTANNDSLCITAAASNVAMTTGDILFVATVLSANGSALPAVNTTTVAGHTLG